jgi:hypothetical protein
MQKRLKGEGARQVESSPWSVGVAEEGKDLAAGLGLSVKRTVLAVCLAGMPYGETRLA